MLKPVYQPLAVANGQIRLLVLQPSKDSSSPIQCGLTYAQLPLKPTYEALSYTWGGPSPEDPHEGEFISLDGQEFRVRENLKAALGYLRNPSKCRTLWIDAICINQNDIKEREEQVGNMRQIYEQAEQVVVWLGETGSGGRAAMQSFAHSNGSISNNIRVWQTERKYGLSRSLRNRLAAVAAGEYSIKDMELGEVAEILDRPWWQRVWIVQEIVLAKKAVVMCGPDEVPWELIKSRMGTDGMYKLQGLNSSQPLRSIGESIVEALYSFPNVEHVILDDLHTKRQSGTWDVTLYELLYRFRRFGCTDARDRVYAFLGLAVDISNMKLTANYSGSLAQVYLDIARALISSHKHLLLLNCKREPDEAKFLYQRSQVYAIQDQGRFFDPDAMVIDVQGKKPRKGWVRLPDGWERKLLGESAREGVRFHDHNSQTIHRTSPLIGRDAGPPYSAIQLRTLPNGWRKNWDNLGRVDYTYKTRESTTETGVDLQILDLPFVLPSWVPNWASWSTKDPDPFPSLVNEEPKYWASGKGRTLKFPENHEPDSTILSLTGMLFDRIATIGTPWCPQAENMPISRKGVTTLREWEAIALQKLDNCPYGGADGRHNAFWRTHIADFPGDQSASNSDKNYFDIWSDRVGWTPSLPVIEIKAMMAMYNQLLNSGFEQRPTLGVNLSYAYGLIDKYKALRARVYRASVNRAMFVTSKGFIGLAPWNARQGDQVCVLFGGCTPYLLRQVGQTKRFTLVGETYVYGIMGGELFSGEMGHARLRTFEII